MLIRLLLAVLLLASVSVVAMPAPVSAADDCRACPAAGGGSGTEDCDDDCPLCACGPHRAPMTEPAALSIPILSPVAEFLAHGDLTALASAPHDILHVPRFDALLPQS